MSFSAAQLKADIEAWSETDLATMTDAEIAAKYNDPTLEEVDRGVVATWQIYERLDGSELAGLANGARQRLAAILSLGTVNVNSPIIAADIASIFGAGSDTVKNLTGHQSGDFPGDDLRKRKVSRGAKQGFGRVKVGHVEQARAA